MATRHHNRIDLPIWSPKEGAPVWERATGEFVHATDGRDYIDLSMGWGACLWGHGLVTERIFEHSTPAELAQGVGSTQTTVIRERAEQELVDWVGAVWPGSPDLRVGILHTGAEAVEAALKTALAATGRTEIVAFKGAYHGSFGSAVAASDTPDARTAFAPTFSFDDVRHVPFGEVPELSERTACVIVEPVQGSAGVVIPPDGFLVGLRAACDRVGALLILDDVLAGCGRTGVPMEGIECRPDVLTLAKALCSGMMGSAVVMTSDVADAAWGSDDAPRLSSTYYGHPFTCAAILEVLTLHSQYDLASLCRHFEGALRRVEDATSFTLRGKGAFWALAGAKDQASQVSTELLERGVIADAAGSDGDVLSLKPSVLMRDESLERVVSAIISCPSAS
jgi:acetylornithine/succinyldiaminopimelate/putrescine aminotransferase